MSLKKYNRAKKSLGQHFLCSSYVIDKILSSCSVRVSGIDRILEIGPGRGALTGGLSDIGLPMTALELDTALSASIADKFPDMDVIEVDARKLDLDVLSREYDARKWLVTGNLPYNVATDIVKRILRSPAYVSHAIVMLQKEVALKFTANEGDIGYCALSAWRAGWWEAEILFDVPAGAFSPPPKVLSSVCEFRPKEIPLLRETDMNAFWSFLRQAFSRPRRALASNLGTDPESKKKIKADLEKMGLEVLKRPGEVSTEQFVSLMSSLNDASQEL